MNKCRQEKYEHQQSCKPATVPDVTAFIHGFYEFRFSSITSLDFRILYPPVFTAFC